MAIASNMRQIAIIQEATQVVNRAFKQLVTARLYKTQFEVLIRESGIHTKLTRVTKGRREMFYSRLDGMLAALYIQGLIVIDNEGNEFWSCGKKYAIN